MKKFKAVVLLKPCNPAVVHRLGETGLPAVLLGVVPGEKVRR
jgi:hypothetical protein